MSEPMTNSADFRFYEELNDFLPEGKRKTTFSVFFKGNPAVKDTIESTGVPHTEIDLILVNSKSVDFSYLLKNGDRVSVYPVFESLDISSAAHLRAKPLRRTKFILDVHLGKLANYLRMLGFDTLYKNNYHDRQIVSTAGAEKRIILTRDVGMLKIKEVTHGYWIRSQDPKKQLEEVVSRFDLKSSIKPFHRCMTCNGIIKKVDKESIRDDLEEMTKKYYSDFYRCGSCGKIYWRGSHYQKMINLIEGFRGPKGLNNL
jgi:uncharacterized protein with PIN domain